MLLRGASGLCALALCALACASCGDDPCREDTEALEECGLQLRALTCESSEGACYADCYARASCEVLRSLRNEDADVPPSLSRCTAQCRDPLVCDEGATTIDARWRCDGEADCADRHDELGCEYHECADGQLVTLDARCDEYEHCSDGSDEEGC